MKIKPFQRVNRFTLLDNYFWDHFMPTVPANAWRIFCYLYRQTAGWNREETALTLAQIQNGTGCKSPKTARKMIELLQRRGVIIVKPGERYALNTDFEVLLASPRVKNTVKNADCAKNTVKNAVKNADYKKKKEENKKNRYDDDDDFCQHLLEALVDINNQLPANKTPISGLPVLAQKLAQRGETSETARAAWSTCQKRARNPLGAFLVWCRDNYLPIASKREVRQNEQKVRQSELSAPKTPATKRRGKSRSLSWD